MNQAEFTPFAPPQTMRGFDGTVGTVSYGNDKGLIVSFYIQPFFMEHLSGQMGHPIYQDRIHTRIMAPGNNKTVWDHFTKGIRYETTLDEETGEYHTEWDLLDQCENGEPTEPTQYPNAWAAFMKKSKPADTGFPIEEWPAVTRSMAESLKMLGIPTVEALAQVSDTNAQSIMGGMKFRNLARAYLDDTAKNKIVAEQQNRADLAEERNQLLEKKVDELSALLAQVQAQLLTQGTGLPIGSPVQMAAPKAATGLRTSRRHTQSARTQQILEKAEQSSQEEDSAHTETA